jgi:hypothetical protein
MVDPELRCQARRYGEHGQKGGGREELQAGHLDSPKDARKEDILGQKRFPARGECSKRQENSPQGRDFRLCRDA